MSDRPDLPTTPVERLALGLREAAQALGISERTLRQFLPELPHFRLGGRVLIPVEPLRQWLREQTTLEGSRADHTAKELLDALDG